MKLTPGQTAVYHTPDPPMCTYPHDQALYKFVVPYIKALRRVLRSLSGRLTTEVHQYSGLYLAVCQVIRDTKRMKAKTARGTRRIVVRRLRDALRGDQ